MILDCCSSAGINRGAELDSEQYVIRRISNPPQIENNTDEEIWSHSTRGGKLSDSFCGMLNASHVLLAACGRDQYARENWDIMHGTFTDSLMKVLNENDINTLTYTSLIHKMEMPEWYVFIVSLSITEHNLDFRQTAHCEGQEVDRRLFNNRALGADNSFILARGEISSGMIILEAGAAHGITVNSRMAIYASNLLETAGTQNPCLGYLTVTSAGPFTCILGVPSDTSQQFRPPPCNFQVYCLLECPASQKIALYCKYRFWLKNVFPPEQEKNLGITIVDDVEHCDLELIVIGGKVYFDRRRDVLITPHIGARISHTIDVNDASAIREVVKSFSRFYRHLTRTAGVNLRNVRMELRLLEEIRDDFARLFIPAGGNLIADEPATIVVDEHTPFGMTIINETELPLYAYLFYFDPTDLTISMFIFHQLNPSANFS